MNRHEIAKKAFEFPKTSLGGLIVGIAFAKFSSLLPVKKVKENTYAFAFSHPKPLWKNHIVVVPKKPITKITSLKEKDLHLYL